MTKGIEIKLLTGAENPQAKLLADKIHAICQAFGAFKNSPFEDERNIAMGKLADRIIEAERATRGLTPPPPPIPT